MHMTLFLLGSTLVPPHPDGECERSKSGVLMWVSLKPDDFFTFKVTPKLVEGGTRHITQGTPTHVEPEHQSPYLWWWWWWCCLLLKSVCTLKLHSCLSHSLSAKHTSEVVALSLEAGVYSCVCAQPCDQGNVTLPSCQLLWGVYSPLPLTAFSPINSAIRLREDVLPPSRRDSVPLLIWALPPSGIDEPVGFRPLIEEDSS